MFLSDNEALKIKVFEGNIVLLSNCRIDLKRCDKLEADSIVLIL